MLKRIPNVEYRAPKRPSEGEPEDRAKRFPWQSPRPQKVSKKGWMNDPAPTALSRWCKKEPGRMVGVADALGVGKVTVWEWAYQVSPPPLWAVLAIALLTKGEVPTYSWLANRTVIAKMTKTVQRVAQRQQRRQSMAYVLSAMSRKKFDREVVKDGLPAWFKKLVKQMRNEEGGPLLEVRRHLSVQTWARKLGPRVIRMLQDKVSVDGDAAQGPTEWTVLQSIRTNGMASYKINPVRNMEWALWYVNQESQVALREKYGGPPSVEWGQREWTLKEKKEWTKKDWVVAHEDVKGDEREKA